MIRPVAYDRQLYMSRDNAMLVHTLFYALMGIINGCEITYNEGSVFISDGYFLTYGRLTKIIGSHEIEAPVVASGELFCRLVFDVDLSKTNTEVEQNQADFIIVTSPTGYPDLVQNDLLEDPETGHYQQLWAQFKVGVGGIYDFSAEIGTIAMHDVIDAAVREAIKAAMSYKRTFTLSQPSSQLNASTSLLYFGTAEFTNWWQISVNTGLALDDEYYPVVYPYPSTTDKTNYNSGKIPTAAIKDGHLYMAFKERPIGSFKIDCEIRYPR